MVPAPEPAAPASAFSPVDGRPLPGWWVYSTQDKDRDNATAAVLQDGRVLIIGGFENPSVALFDVASARLTTVAPLREPRRFASAATLPDGRVIVVGGFHDREWESTLAVDTPELFDPVSGRWEALPASPHVLGSRPALFALANGRVLVVSNRGPTQLLDVADGTWTSVADLPVTGGWLQPIRLADERLAIFKDGGLCQILDLGTGQWTVEGPADDVSGGRLSSEWSSVAQRLPSGEVGYVSQRGFGRWEPGSGSWTVSDSPLPVKGLVGTVLRGGRLLTVGNGSATTASYSETEGWSISALHDVPRSGPVVLPLPDGRAIKVGGEPATIEVFVPPEGI